MRTLILLAGLPALGWIIGCGEEPVVTAPGTPQSVAAAVPGETGPDLARLPDRPYDPADFWTPIADPPARRSARSPGRIGPQITVPDPPNGIFTCQDGVDAAVPGATITVLPTSVVEDVILHVSDVTFRAQGVVQLHGTLMVVADRVRIEGFTVIAPPSPAVPVGIWVDRKDGVVVRDNTLSGWDCAVFLAASTNTRIENNRLLAGFAGVDMERAQGNAVVGNVFDGLTWGVYAIAGSDNRIRDNGFTAVGYGILLDHGSGNFVLRNEVEASEIAVLSMMSHENDVSGNVLTGGDWGLELHDSHFNRCADNRVVDARYDGILLDDANGNTLLRNDTLGPGDDGLDVHGGSNGNTFVGTVSLGHADCGIELESGAHGNHVSHSKAHANAVFDIANYGMDNTFEDNEADCTYGC